jgi:hypothetical protein
MFAKYFFNNPTHITLPQSSSETIPRQEAFEDWGRVMCVGLLKKYLANICRSPRDEKKAPSARAANLKSRRTPCTSRED